MKRSSLQQLKHGPFRTTISSKANISATVSFKILQANVINTNRWSQYGNKTINIPRQPLPQKVNVMT